MKKKVNRILPESEYSAPESNVLGVSNESFLCNSYNDSGLQVFNELNGSVEDESGEWDF